MKVKDCVNIELFEKINETFSAYAFKCDSEKYGCINIFDEPEYTYIMYTHDFGSLIASDLLEDYKAENISVDVICYILKKKYYRNWLRFYDLDNAAYEPLWNVEEHTKNVTETEYGKEVTNEQLTDGHTNVTHGKTQTSEQLDDGVTTNSEYGYNSSTPENTQKTTVDGGKTQLTEGGTTNTNISDGKKSEVNSGKDTVTTTIERGGNIGVAKSTELFEDQMNLLNKWNFIEEIFKDLNKEFSILIWGNM